MPYLQSMNTTTIHAATTTNTTTCAADEHDAMAKRAIEKCGFRPTYVSAGPKCMIAEFVGEAEARACAKEFGRYTKVNVELDTVIGWVCEIDIA